MTSLRPLHQKSYEFFDYHVIFIKAPQKSSTNKLFRQPNTNPFQSNDENSEFATLEPDLNAFNDMNLLIGCVSPLNIQQEDQQIRAPYGFSFICHPVAGTSRATQCLSVDFLPSNGQKSVAGLASPHVNLTDVQISKVPLPINGRISPWIDCDHPNKEFAEYSMQQLDSYVTFKEIIYKFLLF